jgi:YVTN family beta-propeller protein
MKRFWLVGLFVINRCNLHRCHTRHIEIQADEGVPVSSIQPARLLASRSRSRARRWFGIPVAGAVLATAALASTVQAAQGNVYVANLRGNSVSVIDPATNAVVATVPVGAFPFGEAVTPDGSQDWVTNNGSNTVSVIDTATNAVTASIPVGRFPEPIAISPDGTRAYVGHFVSPGVGGVQVLDTATHATLADIQVGNQPFGIAVSPDGSHVYSANFVASSVSVIDAATNTVTATITDPAARTPASATISPDGAHLYTANFNSSNVSVIDTATNTITALIPVGSGPGDTAISADGSTLYSVNENANTVSVINTATNTVVATIPVGAVPTSMAIHGTTGFVSNGAANSVSVIDLTTNTVTATIPVGATPFAVATSPTVAKPAVTMVTPTSGPVTGGTTVTITGMNFTGVTAVSFGTVPATSFTFVSDTSITAVAPGVTSVGTVDVTVTTPAGTSATNAADKYTYLYPFTGFFPPVSNPPRVNRENAGRTIPMQFSLGGAFGLGVLAPGSPTTTPVNCVTGAPVGPAVPAEAAGASGLQFDPATGTYSYNWKTEKAYAGTCQVFSLTLNDGTTHVANFQFT